MRDVDPRLDRGCLLLSQHRVVAAGFCCAKATSCPHPGKWKGLAMSRRADLQQIISWGWSCSIRENTSNLFLPYALGDAQGIPPWQGMLVPSRARSVQV